MQHLGSSELILFGTVAVLLFWGSKIPQVASMVIAALENIRRGGPGSPSHPIPANDSRILNRRNRKSADHKPAI
jgi:Sec-independent protein translocase protein TatA